MALQTMATIKEKCSFSREGNRLDDNVNDSPYAFSDDCYVIGTNPDFDCAESDTKFVRWKTQLNDEISRLVSTEDGSVVVVSTAEQNLSILRGSDGGFLVTRDIKPKPMEEGKHFGIHIGLLHIFISTLYLPSFAKIRYYRVVIPQYIICPKQFKIQCEGCARCALSH